MRTAKRRADEYFLCEQPERPAGRYETHGTQLHHDCDDCRRAMDILLRSGIFTPDHVLRHDWIEGITISDFITGSYLND